MVVVSKISFFGGVACGGVKIALMSRARRIRRGILSKVNNASEGIVVSASKSTAFLPLLLRFYASTTSKKIITEASRSKYE